MRKAVLLCTLTIPVIAGCARQAVVGSGPGAGLTDRSQIEARLQSDLVQLKDAEDRYYAENNRYTDQFRDLGMVASPGVDLSILQGDRTGYSAIASQGDYECAVYGGEARRPRSYLYAVGQVACRP